MNKDFFVGELTKLIKEHGLDHKFPAHLIAHHLWASYEMLDNTVRNTEAYELRKENKVTE
jgi:hypothetical protein